MLRGQSSSQLMNLQNFQAVARISSSALLENESRDRTKGDILFRAPIPRGAVGPVMKSSSMLD